NVAAHVVEDDLIVSIKVGVPGVVPVIPAQRAQAEGWSSGGHERGIVRTSAAGSAGESGFDVSAHGIRHLGQPAAKVVVCVKESVPGNVHYPSGTVILVEHGLDIGHDLRMVFHKTSGTVQSL